MFTFLTLQVGAVTEPEEAVRHALAEVKEGRIGRGNLQSLQISPFCLESKKDEIGAEWEALGEVLRQDQWKAVIEQKKVLGDMAAVSVSLHGPVAPDETRLVVFGLRMIGGEWKVAPVFGSFENAGLGFEAEESKRRNELEDWMALERGAGLDRVIAEAEKNFEAELQFALPEEERKKAKPDEVVSRFLAAAQAGRAKEMLRWLGYSDQIDDEDKKRMTRVISRGMRGEDEQKQWWMLHSGDTLSVKLASPPDGKEAQVVVGFYNPVIQAGQQMQAHRFLLEKEKKSGAWQLILPGNFLYANENSSEFWRARNRDVEQEDGQLLPHMAAILAEDGEKKRAETPNKALEDIMAVLRTGKFYELAPYFVWETEETLRERRIALEQAGIFWQQFRQIKEPEVEKIDLWLEGDHGLGILRLSAAKNFPHIDLAAIRLRKDADGWGMVVNHQSSENGVEHALETRFGKQTEEIKNKILRENFSNQLAVYKADEGEVSEEQARELITNYCRALQSEKLAEVLPLCAVLDAKSDFTEHLEQVYNTMRSGLAQENGKNTINTEITLGDQWAAASVSSKSGIYAETGYPVILMVPTEKGPRVLLDADLWVETSKAKRLRNLAAMRNLEKKLSPEKLASMKKLVTAQQEKMTKLIKLKKAEDKK